MDELKEIGEFPSVEEMVLNVTLAFEVTKVEGTGSDDVDRAVTAVEGQYIET
jgi:hypothetical protein